MFNVSLCCLFFPRDVLDEIWDLIGSVSEGFSHLLFICSKKDIISKQENQLLFLRLHIHSDIIMNALGRRNFRTDDTAFLFIIIIFFFFFFFLSNLYLITS